MLVHLVLHPHGIAPTFLKLDSWSPEAGSIPIITYNVSNWIKKERMQEKNSFINTKTFIEILKNGFNPVLGSIPRLPERDIPLAGVIFY
jgi:hypothetical protein